VEYIFLCICILSNRASTHWPPSIKCNDHIFVRSVNGGSFFFWRRACQFPFSYRYRYSDNTLLMSHHVCDKRHCWLLRLAIFIHPEQKKASV